MVLSDRFAGNTPSPSILRRTVLYVLGFGLGSLAVAGLLSLIFVSVADSVLAGGSASPSDGAVEVIDGEDATSKGPPTRANEGATGKGAR